ncbi:zinc-ribbon domain-containing protein [Paraburkholderia adhaesiva]|uniref:zinc-ribbon domain-containing protein n=1 Tax=Paraburkholderia adhaesiva TaxID=2883244 RepID=UPI001F1A37E5|nr:hypothetical protein [Paraburkholderia adhaesiva]
MQATARERGGECLSERYVNNETKLRWRCAKGHEWDAKPMHIRLGKWCPACSLDWHKITMAQILSMAQARGGECLSAHYDNDGSKLRWRCASGHEWMQTPSKVKRGAWCRECVRPSRTIDDMQAIAHRRGGECLSGRYINSATKLRWRCARGHEWEAIPASVIKGTWCPQCAILDRIRARNGWKRGRYEATGKLAGG